MRARRAKNKTLPAPRARSWFALGDERGAIFVEYLILSICLFFPFAIALFEITGIVLEHHREVINIILTEGP